MQIEYFGTTLNDYGHFRRTVLPSGNLGHETSLDFDDLDFELYKAPKENMVRGELRVYATEKHVVAFIKGSPHDRRPGTVSVFFTKELVGTYDFLEQLKKVKFFNDLMIKVNTP